LKNKNQDGRKMKKMILSFSFLAVAFALGVGGHASESDFWSERHSESQRLKNRSVAGVTVDPVLTDLVEAIFIDPLQTHTRAVLNQSESAVPDWLSPLVLPYGSIQSVHLSQTPDAPLVVLIQDAHEIEEAQTNTAAIVAGFSERPSPLLVGLEGATGAFDFQPYRAWPNKEVTKQIAHHFLKEGYLGGTEFAAMTLPTPPLVWGVESRELYSANVKAFQEANEIKPRLAQWVMGLETQAALLKNTIYSDDLFAFDHHVREYEDQREDLGDFVSALFSFLPATATVASPNLQIILTASIVEKALDLRQVEEERGQLMSRLVGELSGSERAELITKSLDVRHSRREHGSFNAHLKKLCEAHGVSLVSFPQLCAYMDYIQGTEKIERMDLLNELEQLKTTVSLALAQTPEQRTLVSLSQKIGWLKKLTHHKMTPSDWAAYSSRPGDQDELLKEVSSLLHRPFPSRASVTGADREDLSVTRFEDFFRLAIERNDALVDHLLIKMKQDNLKTAILVAGGFHTPGVVEGLRQKGVSSVVVTPTITRIPTEDHSLDVFVRSPGALENLFAGAKTSLASWRLTATVGSNNPIEEDRRRNLKVGFRAYAGLADRIEKGIKSSRSFRSERRPATFTMGYDGKEFNLWAVPRSPEGSPDKPKKESRAPSSKVWDVSILGQDYSVGWGGVPTSNSAPAFLNRWAVPMAVVVGGAIFYSAAPSAEFLVEAMKNGMDMLQGHASEGIIGSAAILVGMMQGPTDDIIRRDDLKRLLNDSLQREKNHLKDHHRVVDFTHYQKKLDQIIDGLAEAGKMIVKKGENTFLVPQRDREKSSETRYKEGVLFQALSPLFERQCKKKKTWHQTDVPSLYPALRALIHVFDRLEYLRTPEGNKTILPYAVNQVLRSTPEIASTGKRVVFIDKLKRLMKPLVVKRYVPLGPRRSFRPLSKGKDSDSFKGAGQVEWLAILNGKAHFFDRKDALEWVANTPRSALVTPEGTINLFALGQILAKLDATILDVYFEDGTEDFILDCIKTLRSVVQEKPRASWGEAGEEEGLKIVWDGPPYDWVDRDHLLSFGKQSATLFTTFILTIPIAPDQSPTVREFVRGSYLSSRESQSVIAAVLVSPGPSGGAGTPGPLIPPIDKAPLPVIREMEKQRFLRISA
jgi:hypothetical protein